MSERNVQHSQAIGLSSFLWLLGLVFITLKLCGVIAWPWIIVTLPIWGPLAIILVITAVVFVCLGCAALVAAVFAAAITAADKAHRYAT